MRAATRRAAGSCPDMAALGGMAIAGSRSLTSVFNAGGDVTRAVGDIAAVYSTWWLARGVARDLRWPGNTGCSTVAVQRVMLLVVDDRRLDISATRQVHRDVATRRGLACSEFIDVEELGSTSATVENAVMTTDIARGSVSVVEWLELYCTRGPAT